MGKPETQDARKAFYADLAARFNQDPRDIAKGFRVLTEDKQHHGTFTTGLAHITRSERESALDVRDEGDSGWYDESDDFDRAVIAEIAIAGMIRRASEDA